MDKFEEMVANKVNGNLKDYNESVKKLSKKDLVNFIDYLFDNVSHSCGSDRDVFEEYVGKVFN